MIRRRLKQEPLAYIVGEKEFFGHRFKVSPHVLIPRPETEHLVEAVGDFLGNKGDSAKNLRIFDCGTGSGCVAISLKLLSPALDVIAGDISEKALSLAQENGDRMNASVQFRKFDAFSKSHWQEIRDLDIIVSNPPYIAWGEKYDLPDSVRKFEPEKALFAEKEGLAFYQAIAAAGKNALQTGGRVFLEIGATQAQDVCAILEQEGFSVLSVLKDYNQMDRVVIAKK